MFEVTRIVMTVNKFKRFFTTLQLTSSSEVDLHVKTRFEFGMTFLARNFK